MPNSQPHCFGKEWEANAVECRGGVDPTYTHPVSGESKREQCSWYATCAAAKTSSRVTPPPIPSMQQQRVLPPQSLIRPPGLAAPTLAAPPIPQQSIPMMHQQPQTVQWPVQQQQVPPPQQQYMAQQPVSYYGNMPYSAPAGAAVPMLVPMNIPMPGAQTHSFLMVPEPYVDDGTPHSKRLMRMMFRSMGKAAALTFANYMDYFPFGGRPPGQGTPGA